MWRTETAEDCRSHIMPSLLELHFDFVLLGDEGLAVLVVREWWLRMTMASAAPSTSAGTLIAD